MTEKPFLHKFAFSNVKSNFIFHDEFAKLFIKIINKKGVINIGGKQKQFIILQNNIIKILKRLNQQVKCPKNGYRSSKI